MLFEARRVAVQKNTVQRYFLPQFFFVMATHALSQIHMQICVYFHVRNKLTQAGRSSIVSSLNERFDRYIMCLCVCVVEIEIDKC